VSTNAKDQVARMLALVPMIRRQGEMHVDAAAKALGTTPAQLVKDLRTLVFCGWPGLYPGDLIEVDLDAFEEGGDGIIRISNADYLTGPMRLSASEAAAVIVALRTLRESADPSVLETIDSALSKLDAAAESGAAQVDVHLPEREREMAALRTRLGAAIRERRQVRLTYHVPARDENTGRVVDPLELVQAQGMSYLDAWCHTANGRRLFRMDRVIEAEVLDTPMEDHPDVAPRDLAEGLFQPSPEDSLVTLRLSPEARWVAEYYPMSGVREIGDGGLEVDLYVADERWLTRLLLRLSPDAELVGPEELGAAFRRAATDALSLYR
jgi:proteasome accessory factor C